MNPDDPKLLALLAALRAGDTVAEAAARSGLNRTRVYELRRDGGALSRHLPEVYAELRGLIDSLAGTRAGTQLASARVRARASQAAAAAPAPEPAPKAKAKRPKAKTKPAPPAPAPAPAPEPPAERDRLAEAHRAALDRAALGVLAAIASDAGEPTRDRVAAAKALLEDSRRRRLEDRVTAPPPPRVSAPPPLRLLDPLEAAQRLAL